MRILFLSIHSVLCWSTQHVHTHIHLQSDEKEIEKDQRAKNFVLDVLRNGQKKKVRISTIETGDEANDATEIEQSDHSDSNEVTIEVVPIPPTPDHSDPEQQPTDNEPAQGTKGRSDKEEREIFSDDDPVIVQDPNATEQGTAGGDNAHNFNQKQRVSKRVTELLAPKKKKSTRPLATTAESPECHLLGHTVPYKSPRGKTHTNLSASRSTKNSKAKKKASAMMTSSDRAIAAIREEYSGTSRDDTEYNRSRSCSPVKRAKEPRTKSKSKKEARSERKIKQLEALLKKQQHKVRTLKKSERKLKKSRRRSSVSSESAGCSEEDSSASDLDSADSDSEPAAVEITSEDEEIAVLEKRIKKRRKDERSNRMVALNDDWLAQEQRESLGAAIDVNVFLKARFADDQPALRRDLLRVAARKAELAGLSTSAVSEKKLWKSHTLNMNLEGMTFLALLTMFEYAQRANEQLIWDEAQNVERKMRKVLSREMFKQLQRKHLLEREQRQAQYYKSVVRATRAIGSFVVRWPQLVVEELILKFGQRIMCTATRADPEHGLSTVMKEATLNKLKRAAFDPTRAGQSSRGRRGGKSQFSGGGGGQTGPRGGKRRKGNNSGKLSASEMSANQFIAAIRDPEHELFLPETHCGWKFHGRGCTKATCTREHERPWTPKEMSDAKAAARAKKARR